MHQESPLGPHLYFIYINDLHLAIKYSKVYCFADDNNLQKINNCIKSINQHVNYDLKKLAI